MFLGIGLVEILSSAMRHIHVSHLHRCQGKFVTSSVILLCIILAILVVSLNISLTTGGPEDKCQNNVCAFGNPHLPMDISCLNHTDCLDWSHPCHHNNCSSDGSLNCVYYGMGDYKCVCKEGFTGRYCHPVGQQIEYCDYCLNGGLCVLNNVTYECWCPKGWTGRHCQQIKVADAFEDSCSLPDTDLRALDNITMWYEIARTDGVIQQQDACTTYNLSMTNSSGNVTEDREINIDIEYLPLNQFSQGMRQGRTSQNLTLVHKNNSQHLDVVQQSFIVEHKEDHVYPLKATLYNVISDQQQMLVFQICQSSEMYGTQNFLALFASSRPDKAKDIDTESLGKLVNATNLLPIIQGQTFCQ